MSSKFRSLIPISRAQGRNFANYSTSHLQHHHPSSRIPVQSSCRQQRQSQQRSIFCTSRAYNAQPATATVTSSPRLPAQSSLQSKPNGSHKSTSPESVQKISEIEQSLNTPAEDSTQDWSKSFYGLSTQPFAKEATDILLAPLNASDIEIKPDGIIYLPEIKYRRILNQAFGPGGWGLAPRGDTIVTDKAVTREYALLAHGRLVSIARGEQDYFSKDGIPTASEGCKSNAMMRCCKDLGVASELWDPRFIRKFKAEHTREVFVEHQGSKKKTKIWLRKGDPVSYPYKETK